MKLNLNEKIRFEQIVKSLNDQFKYECQMPIESNLSVKKQRFAEKCKDVINNDETLKKEEIDIKLQNQFNQLTLHDLYLIDDNMLRFN